ncbi:MAG: hypothetical protein P8Y45_20715 [Exilibacterium sp.]
MTVDDGSLSARRDVLQGSAAHRFEYGLNPVLAFSMELDSSRQPQALQGMA